MAPGGTAWCWRRGACGRPLAPASPHAVACRLPLPAQVLSQKLDGALVCTDLASYGGSGRDLVSATQFLEAGGSAEAQALPIIAKDLMIDPIQIAQAISQGADAVLLVASAVAGDLPERTATLISLPTPAPNPSPHTPSPPPQAQAHPAPAPDADQATCLSCSTRARSWGARRWWRCTRATRSS